MFFDIGPLELVALIILAILVFGPEKLPKMIQDVSGFIRKVRQFSDGAKEDIRSELGPEFKDFDFEDLNPKTFARKHLLDNDDLGIKEIRNGFDLRKDLAEVTDAVNGKEPAGDSSGSGGSRGGGIAGAEASDSGVEKAAGRPNLSKGDAVGAGGGESRAEPPPFDSDAT
ncbi:Sec-independent protein translocase subunit TatB [Streptomyces sp. N2-109]|uniref:Sec-independent protein translocase protein TatB n=1 Tax=Streptomyces gossypii TaxID=2883101 RepID=A0ABT2JVJ4_9ACTN|nr:sec-independent translocase [Streptomyces gossypii]MCT2591915.1 Sec-independent protein translocase subunit TatB [Streptomyces gossypii]